MIVYILAFLPLSIVHKTPENRLSTMLNIGKFLIKSTVGSFVYRSSSRWSAIL